MFSFSLFAKGANNASLQLKWPVQSGKNYFISSTFGESRLDHFHNGLDIAGKGFKITPVGANSRVLWKTEAAGKPGEIPFGGGKTLILDHGDYWSGYMHLMQISEQLNEAHVTGETTLGLAGDTGHSGGAHLHFFVYTPHDGKMHNPLPYLPKEHYQNNTAPSISGYGVKLPDKFVEVDLSRPVIMSQDFPIYGRLQDSSSGRERWGVYYFETYLNEYEDLPVMSVVFDYIRLKEGRWLSSGELPFEEIYHKNWYNLGSGFSKTKKLRIKTGGYDAPSYTRQVDLTIKPK